MVLDETANFLDRENNDDRHDGMQYEAEIAREIPLKTALEIMPVLRTFLFLKFLFLDGRASACPPGVNLRSISVNRAVLAVLVTIDRQALSFPPLRRANIPL